MISCSNKLNIPIVTESTNGNITNDFSYFNKSEIIIPKNQTIGQSLSVIIKNDDGRLIVFDGGRVEDSKYLQEIIKNNGGCVDAWFLTHIHDDHIGAIYDILNNKRFDIKIKNLYYKFADFDWYFSKIGVDAGALNLFEDTLKNYNDFALSSGNAEYAINVNNDIDKSLVVDIGNVNIKCLNNMYLLDDDPINNSSMVYKVKIDNITLIIFGDLSDAGGNRLLSDVKESDLKSDIVVMAHHGQNGVGKNVYEKVKPTIAIWCTSKSIYENENDKYKTDLTKSWLNDLNVKYNIVSYKNTNIIK